MRITKNDAPLGAVVEGIDLSNLIDDAGVRTIEAALAEYGVLCFPGQELGDADLVAFTSRFGPLEVNVASGGMTGAIAEIMVLSNIVEGGNPIGLVDAGQGWHTDMSYNQFPGLATALYALEVPQENGRPLGDTEFSSMYLAYDALPRDIKKVIDDRFAVRDFAKFWNYMITRKGSARPPLSIDQRRKKPPVFHPLVLRHPVSGRKALYADPGYTVSIVGLPKGENDEVLEFLFAHQVRSEFVHRHHWSKHDFLMWDNLASIHRATGGYRPDQRRLMHRAQIILDPAVRPGFAYTDNNTIQL